jgi:hypothetical protein
VTGSHERDTSACVSRPLLTLVSSIRVSELDQTLAHKHDMTLLNMASHLVELLMIFRGVSFYKIAKKEIDVFF